MFACKGDGQAEVSPSPPNVILIMADDMGYECLSAYGSLSYQTPVLDQLAAEGLLATHCYAQPLCTPSRVKIMTGLYNYRNYEAFGYLHPGARTFGHEAKAAGYATCLVGKWQLNGVSGTQRPGWEDLERPRKLGFDEYCLWQHTHTRREGERFANPLIQENGLVLPRDSNAYGPDIFADYLIDFLTRHQDTSFFVYYPMVLVHDPFVPTPDSPEWQDPARRYEEDTTYFKDMVAYTDKIVGRIVRHLDSLGLRQNTVLIFTGDNGTGRAITTQTTHGPVKGEKGKPLDAGTRVPLLINWPGRLDPGQVYEGLIEFSDFFPTLADLFTQGHAAPATDGASLYPLLVGAPHTPREHVLVHYDPRWGFGSDYRSRFVRTRTYKLYHDGRFYHIPSDPLEERPLNTAVLPDSAAAAYAQLSAEIARHPAWIEVEKD